MAAHVKGYGSRGNGGYNNAGVCSDCNIKRIINYQARLKNYGERFVLTNICSTLKQVVST